MKRKITSIKIRRVVAHSFSTRYIISIMQCRRIEIFCFLHEVHEALAWVYSANIPSCFTFYRVVFNLMSQFFYTHHQHSMSSFYTAAKTSSIAQKPITQLYGFISIIRCGKHVPIHFFFFISSNVKC